LSGEGSRTRNGRVRLWAVLFGLLFVAGLFATVGVVRPVRAQPTSAAGSASLAVTATNGYAFDPNTIENVATNTTISVTFTDGSDLAHTLTIIGLEGWVIPKDYSDTQILALAYGSHPKNLLNLNVSGSGEVATGTINATGPGWYEFVCTEGGHFTLGMYGFIAFGMSLPANLTVSSGLPGPGAALYIIVGTIVVLVVIALVLGFVAGRRKGAKHEMAPERLGYAEPPADGEPLRAETQDSRHS